MRKTTYGWKIDTKGNKFPSEFSTYEDYSQKIMDSYVSEMNKAIANGSYATGWTHANCDHAYDYCVGGN